MEASLEKQKVQEKKEKSLADLLNPAIDIGRAESIVYFPEDSGSEG